MMAIAPLSTKVLTTNLLEGSLMRLEPLGAVPAFGHQRYPQRLKDAENNYQLVGKIFHSKLSSISLQMRDQQ
jgi:hypothetical protein